jgi:hypothetical protein
VTISGGSFEGEIVAKSGSNVNLMGSNFELDGVPIVGLELGQPYTITERDARLTCRLADGTSFSFDLNSVVEYSYSASSGDYCSRSATLHVTRIVDDEPESSNIVFLIVASGVALLGVLVARNAIAVRRKPILPSSR